MNTTTHRAATVNKRKQTNINTRKHGLFTEVLRHTASSRLRWARARAGRSGPSEYADGTKFEAMKASYEQALHDVNPVTPPKKKPKAVEDVDLCTPDAPPTRDTPP